MKNKRTAKLLGGLLALVLAVVGGQQTGIFGNDASTETEQQSATNEDSFEPSQQFSSLETIEIADLPAEAEETLQRIDANEPHPYDKDGSTFQNREGILPDHERGHYQEFTVKTPGESTRGARRIVSGQDGERYYTSDHYRSFREIVR